MKVIKIKKPLSEAVEEIDKVNNIAREDFEEKERGTAPVTYKQAVDEIKEAEQRVGELTKELTKEARDVLDIEEIEEKPENAKFEKISLTEGIFEPFEDAVEIDPVDVVVVEEPAPAEEESTPNPPEVGQDMGIAGILSALIKSEWDAIDDYNSAIATLSEMEDTEDIIDVFKDIVAEEHVHVGQLQKSLETISPNAAEIKKGEKEAEGQLEEGGVDHE